MTIDSIQMRARAYGLDPHRSDRTIAYQGSSATFPAVARRFSSSSSSLKLVFGRTSPSVLPVNLDRSPALFIALSDI